MQLTSLENGTRIFFDKHDNMRSGTVGVWVHTGSKNEIETINGISHFIEHIVFKGSEKRSAFQIAEGMDEIGAHVNAYTTKEYTYFYTKALDYQIVKAADILFDMLINPRLDENDIETEKGVVIEEINMCEDDPADVAYEENEAALFHGTSLSLKILGERESVTAIKAQDIREYMKKTYCGDNIIIGLSGNFPEKEMTELIDSYFSNLPQKGSLTTEYTVPFNKGITLKSMPTEQTHIMLSFPGVGIEHKDLYVLQVCMFILGTGTSSMLNQRIREELGLCYSVDSYLARYIGGGYIAVTVSLAPASEEKAIKEVIKIIKEFPKRVTEKQVSIAKEKLIASLIMSREQPQSRFSAMGYNLMLLGRTISDDEIIKAIKDVTLEQVKLCGEKYLLLSNMAFTAVGKIKEKEEYKKLLEGEINECI